MVESGMLSLRRVVSISTMVRLHITWHKAIIYLSSSYINTQLMYDSSIGKVTAELIETDQQRKNIMG